MQNRPPNFSQLFLVAFLIAILGIGTATIVRLGQGVLHQLGRQAANDADNVQWNLIQAEVELLQLQIATRSVQPDAAGLLKIRRRYDILYSRINTLRESPLYVIMFTKAGTKQNLDALIGFLDRWVDIIDSGDPVLAKSLPDLVADSTAVHAQMRALVLDAVRIHASQSDARREEITSTLLSLAVAGIVLILWLISVIVLLMGMYRRLRNVSMDNDQVRSRLEAIVSSSLDAILVLDQDGRIRDTNGAAGAVFGAEPSSLRNRSLSELLRPEKAGYFSQQDVHSFLDRSARRSSPEKERTRVLGLRQSGTQFPAEISVSPAVSDREMVYVVFLRDISNRVEQEQALLRARDEALAGEKAKGHMLTVMSHEMRTPLNGVLGALDILDREDLHPDQGKFVDAIRFSADLLLQHVNDVLELSRLEDGTAGLSEDVFDLEDLVQSLLESQQPVADARGDRLELSSSLKAHEHVYGDPRLLQNALLNLIGNALKFTEDGDVLVDLDRPGNGEIVEFRVSDTGAGISEEDLPRIFDEFVTLDGSFARKAEGTGLGLSITRRTVQAMDGTLDVESIEDEGSLFWMRLPLPRAEPKAASTQTGAKTLRDAVVSPARFLIVEDNEINRMLLQEMLTQQGHEVTIAENGEAGIHAASQQAFDLILMDISMPGLDGITASERIRHDGKNKTTPIVAITAHSGVESRHRISAAKIDDIVTKPFSSVELNRVIARYVGQEAQLVLSHLGDMKLVLGERKAAQFLSDFIAGMDAFVNGEYAQTDLKQQAHRLAGSAGTFGADELHRVLLELEEITGDASEQRRAVKRIWTQVKGSLGKSPSSSE
ncbi:MAG: ATP-binding protein [Paracoccaceae bacterium]